MNDLVTECGVVACEGIGAAQLSDQQGNVIEIMDRDDAAMLGAWLLDWARSNEAQHTA